MSRSDLRKLWASLAAPAGGGEYTFSTARIPGSGNLRVGRSQTAIALLIPSSASNIPSAPIELKNLAVRFETRCRLTEEGQLSEANFTLVRCLAGDPLLTNVFMDAIQAFLIHSAIEGSTSIVSFVNDLVELFMALSEPASSSTIGVWGELFLIAFSTNPDLLLEAWHGLPQERHDFGAQNERIEVKTSTHKRQHTFGLRQLQSVNQIKLWIASIVTEPSAAGTSIFELIAMIAARSSDPAASSTLVRKTAQALGSETTHWKTVRYDTAMAESTLTFLPSDTIPRPSCPSDRILDVNFTVNLEGLASRETVEDGSLRLGATPVKLGRG